MPCAFHLERPLPFQDLDPGCPFPQSSFPKFAPDLIEFDGKEWCPFHLPMESADGSPSPKADWDGKQIKKFNGAIFAFIDKAKEKDRPADLTGVVFPGDIWFDRYRDETSALPPISFARAQFSGADFEKTQFSGDARFGKAQFSGNVGFHEAQFSGDADFWEAQFSGEAWFHEARFNSYTWFFGTQFSGHADFSEAQFSRDAVFFGAQFSSGASFSRAQFSIDANFAGAPSVDEGGNSSENRDLGDRFHWVTFAGAKFDGSASFANRRFLDTTDFSECVFTTAPEFYNCVLHQDTDFTEAQFTDTTSKDAVRAYRTLKLAMEQVRAGDEQAMFYALEMECRRKRKDTPLSVKVFSRLYERAADYGRSFTRPLGWLSETAGIFFLVYLICFAALTTGGLGEQDVGDIGRFTMRQIVPPFDAFTLGTTEGLPAGLSRLPLWLGFVAMIQSILSLGLIALFILALRRRFRMG